jgi:hypothetical protein
MLLYHDFVNKSIDEEEDVLLVAKPDLFTFSAIILLKPKVLATMPNENINIDAKIDTNAKIGIDEKKVLMQILVHMKKTNTDAKINTNLEIDTNTKTNIDLKNSINEPIFDFHTPKENLINIMPIQIKMYDMRMVKWNLVEDI